MTTMVAFTTERGDLKYVLVAGLIYKFKYNDPQIGFGSNRLIYIETHTNDESRGSTNL